MKISILLPYKENFSAEYAGAVSLFVKDIVKNSKFFNTTYVYGNTKYKIPFLKSYKNIPLKKNILESTSKNYVKEFLKLEEKVNSDIVEVHNRPNYIKYLEKYKIRLYCTSIMILYR